jgi:VWFA-related protein
MQGARARFVKTQMRLIAVALLASLSLAPLAPADAQESDLKATVVSVRDATYPDAQAILNIEDASGEPTSSLGPENFTVEVDGHAARVAAAELATSEDAPLDVMAIIDTSGSMEGAPLANAKAAAKAFIQELSPQDRVALISFGDEVTPVLDFTADREAALMAIESLVARGNTALYQATAVGSVKIAQSTASRRAVILLSDGADFGGRSAATREEALGAAASVGVPFFTIAQGSDLDRAYLQQIADSTKGRYLEAPNPEDLQALYATIGRLLRSQYLVTFDASSVSAEQASIRITVRAGEREAIAEAAYRPSTSFEGTVTITGAVAGEELRETRELHADIAPATAGARVDWYVDDVNVAAATTPPYAYTFDPAQFTEGEHAVRATVSVGRTTLESALTVRSAPPAPVPGSSGISPLMLLAAGVAALALLLAGGYTVLRSRARRRQAITSVTADDRVRPLSAIRTVAPAAEADDAPQAAPPVAESIGEPRGRLLAVAGPDAGQTYLVGGSPVSIGSGVRCGVRIPDEELALEEARIWVRNGHLMVHRMTKLSVIANDGVSGGWEILEPGDVLQIGGHRFEFRPLEGNGELPESTPLAFPRPADDDHKTPAASAAAPALDDDGGRPLRLPNLMPRDAGGFPPEDSARAS